MHKMFAAGREVTNIKPMKKNNNLTTFRNTLDLLLNIFAIYVCL